MKQTAFDTRERASELLQEATAIWRQSANSDKLEGLEHDPVFSLLITALAYQANEIDSDIERIKQDVLDEYAALLTPYEAGRPIPATALVEAVLNDDVPEVELTEKTSFYLADSKYQFMPLLRQRVINASVSSVVRLDGKRWQVTLKFQQPVNDLSGMTFAVLDSRFQNLNVTLNGNLLPTVKPWNYADQPLQPCFAIESLLYNKAQMYNASLVGFDLFARQNVALFSFRKMPEESCIPIETTSVDLVFDFKGIPGDYVFDKSHLVLNPVLLVNATLSTMTLSSETPVVRITGYTPEGHEESQLMHLVPPAQDQIFGKTPVEVRRVSADRFNQGSLMRLVNSLTTKFHSDYYAFLEIDNTGVAEVIQNMQEGLLKLSRAVSQNMVHTTSGVYLMINRKFMAESPNISLDLSFVTTTGSAVNSSLSAESKFMPPAGFNAEALRLIGTPVNGFDEVSDATSLQNIARYQLITNDRVVTPADMKILCYTELMNRYGITPAMISSMSVIHHQQLDTTDCGYAFWVDIRLQENPFVQRSFLSKIPEAETYLQKRIEVRSSCIYPIYVNIQMETATT